MPDNQEFGSSPLRFRLKFRQLVLLDALGQTSSLRQAALIANLTQPAATRALSEIESAFGVALFERSHRGMTPTMYGMTLIRHARRLLMEVDKAHEEIADLKSGANGEVRIGSLLPLVSELVPIAVGEVKKDYPRMRISIEQENQKPLAEHLQSGLIDIALCRLITDNSDELEQTILFDDEHEIVVGSNNPLCKKKDVSMVDLVDVPWILPPMNGPLSSKLFAMMLAQTGKLPSNTIESTLLSTNLMLMHRYGYATVMTHSMARFHESQGLFKILPVPLGNLLGPMVLALKADPFRSPAVDIVHKVLLATAKELFKAP